MKRLQRLIAGASPNMVRDCVYTLTFSLVRLGKDGELVDGIEPWSMLPSASKEFGTLTVYHDEDMAKAAADRLLARMLELALMNSYTLRVAPKHFDYEHHEYCVLCRVRPPVDDGRSIVMKVRLTPLVPDFDPWVH